MSINQLQNVQFNLKFVSKQFTKQSKTCEKEQKQELKKCKDAMQKNNMEGAKIYAQNSIRKKNEAGQAADKMLSDAHSRASL